MLEELVEGRMILIIVYRFVMIKYVDWIIVVNEMGIVEIGMYNEFLV